jgi:hypothetical protein
MGLKGRRAPYARFGNAKHRGLSETTTQTHQPPHLGPPDGSIALVRLVAIHAALGCIWDRLDRPAGLSPGQIALLHSLSEQLHRDRLLTTKQAVMLDSITNHRR